MFAEFKHTLRRLRGQIIGWGIGLALYGLLMVSLFDSIVGIEGFAEMIAQLSAGADGLLWRHDGHHHPQGLYRHLLL